MTYYVKYGIINVLENEAIRKAVELLSNLTDEEWKELGVPQKDLDEEIRETLKKMGMPANLNGYWYIQSAIRMCIEDTKKLKNIMLQLYPTIAKEVGESKSRIERSMRHAIEVSWERRNKEFSNRIFGDSVSKRKGRPTNSEYLATITEYLKNRGY